MGMYRDGRQIFELPQEVHREEDNKSNRRIIAKVLVQMSLLVLYELTGFWLWCC
jgi:hypothetical protein